MFASNVKSGDIEFIEIKEYLVEFYKQIKAFDSFDAKLISIRYLVFTQKFILQTLSDENNVNPIENNRLVPKINDDGDI